MKIELVALSAFLAGTLDFAAAGLGARAQGRPFSGVCKIVASGALGPSALSGGSEVVALGVFLHFFIAAIWAVAYWFASHTSQNVLNHPWAFGALFGFGVHVVMSFVVLPLSKTPKRPFDLKFWLTQVPIHVFCVGLPIAVIQSL